MPSMKARDHDAQLRASHGVIGSILLCFGAMFLVAGCEKVEPPKEVTMAATSMTATYPKGAKVEKDDVLLFTNGGLRAALDPKSPLARLTVSARGTVARGGWPKMAVRLNGSQVAEVVVDSPTLKDFSVQVPKASYSTLELAFTNDAYFPDTHEDRNLFIAKVTLAGK
jgi:hypothetical protein